MEDAETPHRERPESMTPNFQEGFDEGLTARRELRENQYQESSRP